jgi:hypothetical protein
MFWFSRGEEILRDFDPGMEKFIRAKVKQGVPRSMRGQVWLFLTKCPIFKRFVTRTPPSLPSSA